MGHILRSIITTPQYYNNEFNQFEFRIHEIYIILETGNVPTEWTLFLGKPAMRTSWIAGTAAHKSGRCRD